MSIDEAKEYLETGGLGEVIGLTSMAMEMKQPKVQMDTDMAMALCLLADEALKRRTTLDAVKDMKTWPDAIRKAHGIKT